MKKKRSRDDRLQAGKFRLLNEMLYTSKSENSFKRFSKDPEMFEEYHKGFRTQIEAWPVKPIELVEQEVRSLYRSDIMQKMADLGCGDGELYMKLRDLEKLKVYSYDLVSNAAHITSCDITSLPLKDRSLDIAVFCLSLMGTNHVDMISEAHRCLRKKGFLIIAEVSSRFDHDDFILKLRLLGFRMTKEIVPNSYFSLFVFKKIGQSKDLPVTILEPCIYKKR